MKDLTHLEKERNIHPNPQIDAFMKVSSLIFNFIIYFLMHYAF